MSIRDAVVGFLLCTVCIVPSVPAEGHATPPPFTLEQVRDYTFHSPPVVAGSVPRMAWVANDRGRDNIWGAEGPAFEARQLTQYTDDDGQEISSLSLSDDGQWLVYVRGGEHGGNWLRSQPANPASLAQGTQVEIWSLPFSGGAPRRLAEADHPRWAPGNRVLYSSQGQVWSMPVDGSAPAQVLFKPPGGGAGSLTWSPDGERLAFVSHRGGHSLIGVFNPAEVSIRWISPSVSRDGDPRWSSDGKRLLFTRRASDLRIPYPGPSRNWEAYSQYFQGRPEPWSIWVADVDSGEAVRWWSSGDNPRDAYPGDYVDWAANDRIVFKSYQDGWLHLYSLAQAGAEPVLLTPGDFSVRQVLRMRDRHGLIFSANTGGDHHDIDRIHLFQVAVDRPGHRQLVQGTGLEWGAALLSDGRLAFSSATAQRPPLPALLSLGGGQPRLLLSHRPDYPAARLVTPRKVVFQAEDGMTVHGQLFEPAEGTGKGKGRPAVVWIHGGPGPQQLLGWHPSSYYSNDYAVNQYLASRGFVVLTVNYRTDWGYGYDYNFPAQVGVHGGSEYRDIRAAGRYLQSLPQVDGQRIGAYGGSYGGYLTAMALAHDSELFKVGVDIHGVHDWIEHYNLRDLFAKLPYDFAGDTRQMLDVVWRASPVSAMDTWRSPVLLISGDDDRNVAFSQTLDLARRLDKAGVYHESLVLPGETHSLLRYANVLRMNAATVEFLERHLLDP